MITESTLLTIDSCEVARLHFHVITCGVRHGIMRSELSLNEIMSAWMSGIFGV